MTGMQMWSKAIKKVDAWVSQIIPHSRRTDYFISTSDPKYGYAHFSSEISIR